ncbi:phage tail protein [Rhizobium sp. AAP43]|uniref:phage tail protein n=1 Tax=Rhizobium sp. AAP43 TaxID=1523420 RepID=UPI0006B8A499|nr:phage tail protein [Rhizobium sp. AAP43]KPF47062.1 hypothetical protein IP76_01810 [Rhizobium sp. AAP43]
MKLIKLLMHCGASYIAMVSHASADPISIIATAIHGFLLSSTAIAASLTGTLATIAANALVFGGLALASGLAGRPRGGAVKPSDAKSNFETGESSVIEGVGRVRVGGLKAFGNSDGSTRARLICHLQGPIDAIEAYYLGQREVTVEANGDISSPPWVKPGGSWANWLTKAGTGSETAWSGLMALFPTRWTSAHRVRGIAQSQLRFYNPGLTKPKYLSLYQNGAPDAEVIARASLIYDPRTGLTAWTDNGPLICAHVLRRDPAFGFDRFNWTKIAATATAADQLVTTRSGTEKRCRLWGIWAWESERGETMKQFLESAGLEIRLDENGLIYFEFIDDTPTAEIAFTPEDIYDYSWSSGPEAVERPNICRVKYYSPERLFEIAEVNLDGIAWARIEDEIERYGPKYFDIELPFCPSAAQAQRIARRRFLMERADRGTIVTNMVGLAAWGLFYADITEPDLGDTSVVRMQPPRVDDESGSVEIPFVAWPQLTAWVPATDEALPPEVVPELGYESDLLTPNAPMVALQITYPGGGKELRIGFALPAQSYDTTEATYRAYSAGLPGAWESMTEGPATNAATFAYVAGDFEGATIDARVRVFKDDEGSYNSANLNTVVAVDNAAPAAPSVVSAETVDLSLNAVLRTSQMRVAAFHLERRTKASAFVDFGPWAAVNTYAARPGVDVTISNSASSSYSVQWRIQALTSDGTGSGYLSYSGSAP